MTEADREAPATDETREIAALVIDVLAMPRPDAIRPIGGGVNGSSFLVETGGRRCVLKRSVARSGALLGVDVEYALLERLAETGIGPVPVAADVGAGLLVTELVPGAPLSAAEVRSPAAIERIAGILRRLHAVDAALPAYAPRAYAESYLGSLGGIDALEPAEARRAFELVELAQEYTERFASGALCHNDLDAANIIAGADWRLIDFEYAASASPVLDLASLAAMNDFGPLEESRLIEAYFATAPAPFSRPEFAKVRRLVHLLAHFWARTREAAGGAGIERYIEPAVGGG